MPLHNQTETSMSIDAMSSEPNVKFTLPCYSVACYACIVFWDKVSTCVTAEGVVNVTHQRTQIITTKTFYLTSNSWETIFSKSTEVLTPAEMACCRRIVQLCRDCLLIVYQFAAEAKGAVAQPAQGTDNDAVRSSRLVQFYLTLW